MVKFRGLLVAILLLSVAWKVVVPDDRGGNLKEEVAEFLRRNHFDVFVNEQLVNYMPIVQGSAPPCRLQIARLTPDGSNWNFIRHLTADTDHLFVVFRGRLYSQQPILRTVLSHFWSRFLRELGLIDHVAPVLAVAANSSCEVARLPWYEIN